MAEDQKKIVNPKLPVILIAPLDWGNGHTTRCIPIIKALTKLYCSVLIACNSTQQEILLKEFPNIQVVPLNGYNISYRKGKLGTLIKIILQIPKILISINKERYFLENFMVDNEVDVIISDNRYGLFHPKAYSVIMTHQLGLRSGLGKWADRLLQRQLYRYLSCFDLCLVPDLKKPHSIAGDLSNPAVLPSIPIKYIGPLTRFTRIMVGHNNKQPLTTEDSLQHHQTNINTKSIRQSCISENIPIDIFKKILVILSGPEPQRTILEEKIYTQIRNLKYDFTIVRGVNSKQSNSKSSISESSNSKSLISESLISEQSNSESSNSESSAEIARIIRSSSIKILDFADSSQLEKLIDESDLIICRSGYSSIMDLLLKRKKTIMIPTPGQGEQEYLAKRLSAEGYIIAAIQKNLNLGKLLQQAQQHSYKSFHLNLLQDTSSINPIQEARSFDIKNQHAHCESNLLEQTLKEIIDTATAKKSALTFAP